MSPKQVQFSDITIYEHPYILGDNPACANGIPLTIEWEAQSETVRDLGLYEYMRGPRRHGRRELAIPVQERSRMMLNDGYTLEDIANTVLEVEEIKRNRADSLRGTAMERAGSFIEKTGKLPMGILNGAKNLFAVKPVQKTVHALSA
eukprot:Nitzschia sp. Nitz4//scaffold12_size214221//188083//188523//NITZ4_001532-RA/size214221-processed-gene-0.129-mRNA-1//1//CDS//3329535116//2073//frame0